ncbi:hypothetical protein F4678DRAFT_434919 [Xylaria arbuscula]|nr:hypothetical protein F4678DRAFT_434919 [Xylaria arbuscula]
MHGELMRWPTRFDFPARPKAHKLCLFSLQCVHCECRTSTYHATTGRKAATEEDVAAAREITQLLGDLPLALVQVSTFKNSVIAAQAFRLLGHISLDLARPRAALEAYQDALAARRQIEKPESPPIADVYDSIVCSLTEIGNVVEAAEYLNRAMAIHAAHDPLKRGRTEAIRALTFLRAGQPDKSLEALQVCWGLQCLTQEQVEASGHPKHSGDIVLLARIYWMQGEKERAQELTSRTISIRKELFGQHGGPRVADSIFQLARTLQDRDKDVLATKLLNEIVDISGTAVEMRGHLARGGSSQVEHKLRSP